MEDKMADEDRPKLEESNEHIVVDPSDAVTGLGFVLGVVGAAVGVISAIVVSPQIHATTLLYCVIGGLAGGSAGIVTGGMIGAVFSVARGTPR